MLREWAYRYAYPTSHHRTQALSGWTRWYNHQTTTRLTRRPATDQPRLTPPWSVHLGQRRPHLERDLDERGYVGDAGAEFTM